MFYFICLLLLFRTLQLALRNALKIKESKY
jgi:hypothetical protein